MSRVRVWTGSRWSDVSVWTGTQWKSYVDDVYGAGVYAYDMNSGANGWVQQYGADAPLAPLNWNNVHLYCNDFGNNAYGTAQALKRTAMGQTMKLKPGTTVHVQASLLVQHISGYAGDGGRFRASCTFGEGLYSNSASGVINLAAGWFGWATVDTRSHGSGWTVPENGGLPYEVVLNNLEVSCDMIGGALGPFGTYRFFCDWYQLIDQNGNLLTKLTADRIHALRAWNGSAWV